MARVRKTISFKEDVFEKLDEERGGKSLSTHVNDILEEKYNLKKPSRRGRKNV